tara:strand:- start:3844 stop:5259 length:1416 start_codon:yes stop_codon:yes gene_type:complete
MSYLTKDTITDVHPVYSKHLPRWRYFWASFNGGFEYRNSGLEMLRRYMNEDLQPGQQYAQRLDYTALENSCKLVVDTYKAFLFRSLPVRALGNLVNLPYTHDFIDNCDLDGTDLDQFMKEANSLAMIYGHCWVLVDKPQSDSAVTLEQEIEQGIRPYAQLITPENILDWNYVRVNGRYQLDYLKQKEQEDEDTLIVRVWTPETICRYQLDKKGSAGLTLLEEIPNSIGSIPFAMLKANPSHTRGLGMSDLADVAKIQQAIFNLMSEAEQAIRISGHPSLVKTASTDASAGAGAIITIDETLPGELKPFLLQPSSANIDAIIKVLKEHQSMIMKMTHLEAVVGQKTVAKSGVALQTEFSMLNTRLGDKADSLERLEHKIWELFQTWTGVTADDSFLIQYKKKFDLRDENNDLANYKTVREMNLPSFTLNKELDKQIAMIVVKNGDVLESIVDEIDNQEPLARPETDVPGIAE